MPFQGLVAAPHTPFTSGGALALNVIERQAELLLADGVRGAFVCGTTGEGHSLSVEERLAVAQRWAAVARGQLRLLVHVGHNALPDARTLAAHAARVGADGIAALAPSYHKPATVDDLIDFCADVAGAAPGLPFYFYDIPSMTGVSVPAATFLARGAERIPTLAGAKYTNHDLMGLQECLGLGERFEVFWGLDELLLAALALGVRGAVGSTYNFAAPLYRRIVAAFEAGDLETARALQRRAVAMVRVMLDFGVLRASKALMARRGVDCGPVRPPLRPMTAEETRELWARVEL